MTEDSSHRLYQVGTLGETLETYRHSQVEGNDEQTVRLLGD